MLRIRQAKPTEADTLSGLARKSKAYWGYPAHFIELCREELTYSGDQIGNNTCVFYVAEHKQNIVGFYALTDVSKDEITLEALFIAPTNIKQGIGSQLFKHAKRKAIDLGGKSLVIQSDPNALGFYESVGCRVIGQTKSESVAGRYLPLLEIILT